jgi:hypothetical protein
MKTELDVCPGFCTYCGSRCERPADHAKPDESGARHLCAVHGARPKRTS